MKVQPQLTGWSRKERGITITSAAVSCQWNFPTDKGTATADTKNTTLISLILRVTLTLQWKLNVPCVYWMV